MSLSQVGNRHLPSSWSRLCPLATEWHRASRLPSLTFSETGLLVFLLGVSMVPKSVLCPSVKLAKDSFPKPGVWGPQIRVLALSAGLLATSGGTPARQGRTRGVEGGRKPAGDRQF